MHITSVSLIVFTVLMQTAAGLMLVSEVARAGRTREETVSLTLCLPMALGLGILSLLFASAHSANPLAAIYVLFNIFSSALSLEIFFCGVFIACMAITLFLRIKASPLEHLLGKLSAAAGLATIATITNVYIQDTIPTFNTSGTLFSFVGTGCLAGGVLGSLLYGIGIKKWGGQEWGDLPAGAFITVALLGIGFEFVAGPLNMIARSYEGAYGATGVDMMLSNATTRCLSYGNALTMAGLIACLLGWVGFLKKQTPSSLIKGSAVAFVCVLAGTLTARYFFYASYIRLGI